MNLVTQFSINREPPEGDFHFDMKWGGELYIIIGVDFPVLGFGIAWQQRSREWEWCGDKPSDEILTLLILALR